jgi:hypothetical protein
MRNSMVYVSYFFRSFVMNFKSVTLACIVTLCSLSASAQNSPPTHNTPRVDQRENKQNARIQQGVSSGQLNARETYRLDKQQAAIHQTQANAKADGKVTRAERKRLARMQNRASRNIYNQKHDAQKAR